MRKTLIAGLLIAGGLCILGLTSHSGNPAVAFLESLDSTQLSQTQFAFDNQYRQSWHFLPAAMWTRPGIGLGELSEEQHELLNTLLKKSLSKSGYAKVQQIISLEDVLWEMGGDKDFRDPGKYYTAFFGDPTGDLWAWSFEGHHISLNFTITEGRYSMTPRFWGANPAIVPSGKRKGERTLSAEDDLGRDLIQSLREEQRAIAIFQQEAYPDIVTANASEVGPLKPVGIMLKDLDTSQQEILMQLLNVHLSSMPDDLAVMRMMQLWQEEFEEIRFGWAGGVESGEPHYYRIQGKTFMVEFDNTQDDANHIHTVWRDFDGDFGRDMIREHYQRDHKHE